MDIPEEDRTEILYDYEEHFRIGLAEGKSEEEIAQSLGDVRTIARQFKADIIITKAQTNTTTGNIFRAVLATLGLGFFNLVFVVGPFFGVLGVLIGFFAGAIGATLGGIALFIAAIIAPAFPGYFTMDISPLFAVFLSFGITAFGLLLLIGCCYAAKYFFIGTLKYLRWNLDIIKK